jgi:DUF1680 family protein
MEQRWEPGDLIELVLDVRCRLIQSKPSSAFDGNQFQALVRGPVVLARDENLDPQRACEQLGRQEGSDLAADSNDSGVEGIKDPERRCHH